METLRTRTGSKRLTLGPDFAVAFDSVTLAFVLWNRIGSEHRDVADASFATVADLKAFLAKHDVPGEAFLEVLPATAREAFLAWDARNAEG